MDNYNQGVAPVLNAPRSHFNMSNRHATTLDFDNIVPVYHEEVLPGDTISMNAKLFGRFATLINPILENTSIFPLMDNMFLDVHFFSVPIRQIWTNFRKFCGEQTDPNDSIDYTVPTMTATTSTGYSNESLHDYLGLPTLVPDYVHSSLFHRAYNHIYNEWYRDQNLIDSVVVDVDDGPDDPTDYTLLKRGKRHDYFTSCLPWLQKGDAVDIPLGTSAPVTGIGVQQSATFASSGTVDETGATSPTYAGAHPAYNSGAGYQVWIEEDANNAGYPGVFADLSTATAATINQLRQAFQIQKLLERDARSGTRYSEIVKAHFNVNFLDVTYRPEFLGGNSTPINIQQVPQTSSTDATTPQGNLAAFGTATINGGGFTKSFTEHCIIIGIASARADLTYQQGINRMFLRSTRYDYFWPALAHIGEQAVTKMELFTSDPTLDTGSTGTPDNDRVFGYQERWAEYRYKPSLITGKLRSNDPTPLDAWHLSQDFADLPTRS